MPRQICRQPLSQLPVPLAESCPSGPDGHARLAAVNAVAAAGHAAWATAALPAWLHSPAAGYSSIHHQNRCSTPGHHAPGAADGVSY